MLQYSAGVIAIPQKNTVTKSKRQHYKSRKIILLVHIQFTTNKTIYKDWKFVKLLINVAARVNILTVCRTLQKIVILVIFTHVNGMVCIRGFSNAL